MTPHRKNGLDQLKSIARQAMIERGLQPDFSPAALVELNALTQPARESGPEIRDLRGLLWASIDNDDSRDLDQLSVAERAADGATRILVAIADVDALVQAGLGASTSTRAPTPPRSTRPREIFPMLPEKLSTDLTSLGRGRGAAGDRHRDDVAADGAVVGSADLPRRRRQPRQARLQRRRGVARRQRPRRRQRVAGGRRAGRATAPAGPRRAGAEAACATRTARWSSRRSRRAPVFDDGALTDLRPRRTNRAKELIEDFMIAANGVDRALPRAARACRRCAACCARRSAGTGSSRWPRSRGDDAAGGSRMRAALDAFLTQQRDADPARFPDLSLSVVKLLGRGRIRARAARPAAPRGTSGSRCATTRTPRRRTAASPTSSRSACSRRRSPARASPYSDDELAALAAHCTEQEDNAAKVERQVQQVGGGAAAASRIGADVRRHRHRRVGQRAPGCASPHPPAEGRVVRGFEGLDVGDRVRVELDAHRRRRAASSTFATRVTGATMKRDEPPRVTARLQGRGVPRQRRRAPAAHPRRVPGSRCRRFQQRARPRHHRVLRLGAARRATGRSAATTTRRASWRACVTALVEEPAAERAPLRRLLRRRRRHHGGRQPRRRRRRRPDHRPQHRPAARAAAESLHHARAVVRVPLLLHAQAVVRAPRARAGRVPRRLRHARRADRDPDARADRASSSAAFRSCSTVRATGTRSSTSRRWCATA